MLEALINTVCLIHIRTSSRFGTRKAVAGKVQANQPCKKGWTGLTQISRALELSHYLSWAPPYTHSISLLANTKLSYTSYFRKWHKSIHSAQYCRESQAYGELWWQKHKESGGQGELCLGHDSSGVQSPHATALLTKPQHAVSLHPSAHNLPASHSQVNASEKNPLSLATSEL